jgi:hypothetical protein
MATRLEELVFRENQQKDISSDSHLVQLQMLAMQSLQQDKAELATHVQRLEQEMQKLVEVNLQQSNRHLMVLNKFTMQRGRELIQNGEVLVAMAKQEAKISGHDEDGSVAL